ncbi:MAG: hypothetical protein WBX27_07250 [Specibacter sp.]
MSPQNTTQRFGDRGWQVFSMAALILAIGSLASLLAVLFVAWGGGEAWAGYNFIAEIGLPVAFVMMGISIAHMASRRRRL